MLGDLGLTQGAPAPSDLVLQRPLHIHRAEGSDGAFGNMFGELTLETNTLDTMQMDPEKPDAGIRADTER